MRKSSEAKHTRVRPAFYPRMTETPGRARQVGTPRAPCLHAPEATMHVVA